MHDDCLDTIGDTGEPLWSVLPKGLEAIGCELGVAHRVLDVRAGPGERAGAGLSH